MLKFVKVAAAVALGASALMLAGCEKQEAKSSARSEITFSSNTASVCMMSSIVWPGIGSGVKPTR